MRGRVSHGLTATHSVGQIAFYRNGIANLSFLFFVFMPGVFFLRPQILRPKVR